jgi:hypothetical protein
MPYRVMSSLPLVLALSLALAAPSVEAQQGRGSGRAGQSEARRGEEERRPVLQRRDSDDRERLEDRYEGDDRYDSRRGSVPPGWCQGRGNPHNTVENCGYRSGSGAYEAGHADFHRYLDDKYRALSAQRPRDTRWQLELRARKAAEHDRWHG